MIDGIDGPHEIECATREWRCQHVALQDRRACRRIAQFRPKVLNDRSLSA
jgi:hypothetical protein